MGLGWSDFLQEDRRYMVWPWRILTEWVGTVGATAQGVGPPGASCTL